MRYSLRPARVDDVESMMAIGHGVKEVRGWNEKEEERGFLQHFVPELTSIILVEDSEAGYIKMEPHPDHIYIDGIYLASSHRRRGLGTRVISDAIASAHRDGKRIRLRVLKPNPAHRLYERLGFRETGEDSIHVYMEA